MKQGLPLVGPSGEINWQFASRYGRVYRQGNYVTNWRKIPFLDQDKKLLKKAEEAEDPDETQRFLLQQRDQWSELLWEELEGIEARTIVVLGSYALDALLGPPYNLYWANGVAIRRGDRVFIPVVHPAAGIHETSMLQKTAQGYQGIRRYLDGGPALEWRQWAPEPETKILIGGEDNSREPWGPEIAIDTEGSKEEPYCLTFDTGRGPRLIWAWDEMGLRTFAARLKHHQPLIILHNLMHDASVCRSMGVDIFCAPYTDTMVLAYLLQDVPMGLKDLTRRLLGMDMKEYTQVVGPWAAKADQEWLSKAAQAAWEHVKIEQQYTAKGKPRMQAGAPLMKRVGPDLQLSLIQHLERSQKLAINEEKWAENMVGEKRPGLELKWVPEEIAAAYAGKDATTTRSIYPILWKRVQAEGLEAAAQLDLAALPLIEDMQRVGLHIDIPRYMEVMGHVSTERDKAILECQEIVGSKDFNPGSSEQVEEFCKRVYEAEGKLKLEKLTKSKARFSTDNNVLSKLKDEHPFIPAILRYRELDKYQGTYLLPLGNLIQEMLPGEFRLHPNLRTTTVVSGRLSAHAPNALAWPSRSKLGKMLRSIFRARPGHILAAWDLSQIELRIVAAFSGDEVMSHAFKQHIDLHSNLAANLFGVPYDVANSPTNKAEMRDPCKTIHYLLIYGGGGDKLFEELIAAGIKRFSREDCFNLIRDTWRVYRKAGLWMKEQAQIARAKGFASTFLGRRRFLPGTQLVGDRWPAQSLRREAERQAANHPVQGGAGELLKRTEVAVWNEVYPEVESAGHYFRLWLQVHDELMGETTEAAYPMVDRLMRQAMTQDSWLTDPIPLETDSARGAHWGEL